MRHFLKKNVLCLLLLSLLAAALSLPALAAPPAGFSLGVTAFGQSEHTAVDLWWDETAGTMRLFLPSGCDFTSLTVRFSGASRVTVDGAALTDGKPTGALTPGAHRLVCDGTAYPLEVHLSANFPAVFLETASGSLDAIRADKNHKEKGSLTIVSAGAVAIDDAALKSVKGRGNSTWEAEKKPYNIKFDKSTDVLGMGKAKKWSLLANFFDESLLRNAFSLGLAADFGLPFTPSFRMVDLYANGEYQGNYLVVESVEIGDTRVAIADLEDANEAANPEIDVEEAARNSAAAEGLASRKWAEIASPADVTGGYLLETEFDHRYGPEVSGFVTEHGQHMVLKSPEYASEAEVAYIADFYAEMEQALYAENGYNGKGRYYLDYFDAAQLVKMYILTEYTFHRDAGLSSCYFYKDAGEDLLHAGPAWDFDLSLGNTRYSGRLPFDVSDPESWWANALFYKTDDALTPTVFHLLYRHEDFRALTEQYWKTLSGAVKAAVAELPRMIDEAAPSALMDAFRWNLRTGSTAAEKEESYRRAGDRLRVFAEARAKALDKGFGENAAAVFYHANGGSGLLANGTMLTVGDEVTLREINHSVTPLTAPDKLIFAGWNTAADGSGKTYQPGEKVPLTKKTTHFYAQWQRNPNDVPPVPAQGGAYYTVDDADLDGAITPADARFALRTAVKLENPSEAVKKLSDADGDQTVTPADARIILRVSVRLEVPSDRTVLIPMGQGGK